jgi:hypothetical protein
MPRIHTTTDITELCPASTIVYRAAANAYRNLADTPLTAAVVERLLESPEGYLRQFESLQTTECTSKLIAQVFAHAITAAIDAAAEIGTTGPMIAQLAAFPVPTLVQRVFPSGSTFVDPAKAAFLIINILLQQFIAYMSPKRCEERRNSKTGDQRPNDEVAIVFSQAFQDIYTNLITTVTLPTGTVRLVDITYVSAIGRYVNLELGIRQPLPIIPYSPAV